MYYLYLFTIHSPPFFGPLWSISPSSVSLLTAFSIARVEIPIASAISRSDTFGLDCIISLIFTEVFTELSTELFPEPWSDCSVEEVFFFLSIVVKKPSVLYSAGGNPSSERMRAIRGMPVPTLSTRCIRVNILKMSGFLEVEWHLTNSLMITKIALAGISARACLLFMPFPPALG